MGGPIAPCNVSVEEMLANHGYSPAIQLIRGVKISPAGELWVLRASAADGSDAALDVFDREGEYLGTLPQGTPLPVVFLSEDRVWFAETDALGVQRLVIARVVRE